MASMKDVQWGKQFGCWTVIGPMTGEGKAERRVPCRCECGKEQLLLVAKLKKTTTCWHPTKVLYRGEALSVAEWAKRLGMPAARLYEYLAAADWDMEQALHGCRERDRKRLKVQALLADPEWAACSDKMVAIKAGVSHPFVGKIRREMEAGTTQRRGADGRVRNIVNIRLQNQSRSGAKMGGADGGEG